jgi:hypothetical protein
MAKQTTQQTLTQTVVVTGHGNTVITHGGDAVVSQSSQHTVTTVTTHGKSDADLLSQLLDEEAE